MSRQNVNIEPSWKEILDEEFDKEYFQKLIAFLKAEKKKGKVIYPPGNLIFNAFWLTPFYEVKAIILGQDPYHGAGQAHGLAFSVPYGVPPPPSLQNIFKELNTDLGLPIPQHGNLEKWALEGVFLLNAILTVEANKPASHRNKGWEIFTDTVIRKLNEQRENLVFILWGRYAQAKEKFIDTSKHKILKSSHPSPFSARYGFFGSRPFSQTNAYLEQNGIEPIDWNLNGEELS